MSVDGRRTIWILSDGLATSVDVLPGETDGSKTEIREGEIAESDLVITDLTPE